jgi:hypothetical protein
MGTTRSLSGEGHHAPLRRHVHATATISSKIARLSAHRRDEEVAADGERDQTGVAEADGVPSAE